MSMLNDYNGCPSSFGFVAAGWCHFDQDVAFIHQRNQPLHTFTLIFTLYSLLVSFFSVWKMAAKQGRKPMAPRNGRATPSPKEHRSTRSTRRNGSPPQRETNNMNHNGSNDLKTSNDGTPTNENGTASNNNKNNKLPPTKTQASIQSLLAKTWHPSSDSCIGHASCLYYLVSTFLYWYCIMSMMNILYLKQSSWVGPKIAKRMKLPITIGRVPRATCRPIPPMIYSFPIIHTPTQCMHHMAKHGVSLYPNILKEETADELRDWIVKQNKMEEGFFVISGKHRYTFGIGVNQAPVVSRALREIAEHPVFRPAIDEICGENPAVIEFTAITRYVWSCDAKLREKWRLVVCIVWCDGKEWIVFSTFMLLSRYLHVLSLYICLTHIHVLIHTIPFLTSFLW